MAVYFTELSRAFTKSTLSRAWQGSAERLITIARIVNWSLIGSSRNQSSNLIQTRNFRSRSVTHAAGFHENSFGLQHEVDYYTFVTPKKLTEVRALFFFVSCRLIVPEAQQEELDRTKTQASYDDSDSE